MRIPATNRLLTRAAARLLQREAPVQADAPAPAAEGWLATRTSRRRLLQYGAAGAVSSAGVIGGLSRWTFAAHAGTVGPFNLAIRDGLVRMIDGTSVYMWGYGPLNPSDTSLYHLPADSSKQPFSKPFTVPGPAIVVAEDQAFDIQITNTLDEDHGFAICTAAAFTPVNPTTLPEPSIQLGTPTIAKGGGIQTLHVPAGRFTPGTYMYGDPLNSPVNRVLGLNGALIVRPASGSRTIQGEPWVRERLWVLNDIDPAISAAVQQNRFPDPGAIKSLFWPRYFTIGGMRIPETKILDNGEIVSTKRFGDAPPPVPVNMLVPSAGGKSGRDSIGNEETILRSEVGNPTLLRVVNAGLCCHSLHWHGNHVIVVADTCGGPFCQNMEKDVVIARPGAGKDVIYPFHPPLDATTDLWKQANQTFPMHCHAEMSQTAAGGLYPNGMLGHIEFDVGNLCITTSSS